MITIDSLVHDFGFELSYLAGRHRGDRPLSWAHVIDLDDPWNWIGRGELILTTGAGIPKVSEQPEWMLNVIGSGSNGLVVAPRPGTEALSESSLHLADEHGFPVLAASFGAKFTELAKEIINNTLQRDSRRLATAQRAFNMYSASLVREEPMQTRLQGIAQSVGLEFVITDDHGLIVARTSNLPTDAARDVPLDSWTEPLSATIRLETREGMDAEPSLRHAFVTIVAIELQRTVAQIRLSNRTASLLMKDVLAGQLDLTELLRFLNAEDAEVDRSYVFACLTRDADVASIWDRLLAPSMWGMVWAGVAHRASFGLLIPAGDEALAAVQTALPSELLGISNPINEDNPPVEAFNQALLAAEVANVERPVSHASQMFSDDLLLPSSHDECQTIAHTLLGSIARYDDEQGTKLLKTLEAYYRSDLSPGKAAEVLHIHRHTLIYRLKTIERLTGMNPSATRSIATFWIALEAARRTNWRG